MAKLTLTYKKRKKMKKSTFAIPEKKKYPLPDLAHARNAAARVSAFGTPDEKKKVARAIKRKFPAFAKRSAFVKRVLGTKKKK